MANNSKTKISSLALDLNMKNKDLIALCDSLGLKDKKQSSNIENDELAVILNRLTLDNQMNNFDAYTKGEAKLIKIIPAPIEEKKPATKKIDKVTENKVSEPEKTESEKENVSDPAIKPAEKKADAKKPVDSKADKKENIKPINSRENATNRFDKKPEFNHSKDKKNVKEQKKPEKQERRTIIPTAVHNDDKGPTVYKDVSRVGSNIRVIDTHAGAVDLSKYDEKQDNFDEGRVNSRNEKKNVKKPEKQNIKNEKNEKNDRTNNIKMAPKVGKNDKSKKDIAAEKKKRAELEKARKQQLTVSIPDEITVGELAVRLKASASEVIKRLMLEGIMAGVNQIIDYSTAEYIADAMGAKVVKEVSVSIEEKLFDNSEDADDDLVTRAPVVVVMGHVDHGKTSILDSIRKTNVTSGEAGGITQAIGAYRVNYEGQPITFLDTPGHEAFTAMRARGAMATDIAILVVAADDGIMPQTIEAINHAKAANLDIVVAINKMDKLGANPDRIREELTKYDLIPEEWGGNVICVPCSALTGMGIDKLLENVLLVAEMKDLKANPKRRAKGIVIEAKLDKGRGPVATVLVQNGTLHSGDTVIAGNAVGRVRVMKDDAGRTVAEAGPSFPVEIVGLSEVPVSGDEFNAVEDEKMARELAEKRRQKQHDDELNASAKVSLDDLFAQISEGAKELKVIVKADVVGSAEAVKQSLEKLSNDEVKVKVIHSAVGGIIEGDVMLASASNAIIVGFNVRPDKSAIDAAERQKVDIRTYRIIYECIDEISAAMKGMLSPVFKEELLGHAEVRQTIHVPSVGTIAGCYITDGKVTRKSSIRVLRDSIVIFEDKISSLKRFKDDVKDVASGYECGIGLEKFNDIKVGDVLEAFEIVEA